MIKAILRRWIQVLGLVSLGLALLMSCSGETSREGETAVSQIVLNIQPPPANHSLRSPALAALATGRQVTAIASLQIDVHVPEQETPIRAQVDNLQSESVVVEIEVPQGNGRRIEVRAFNAFNIVIYEGTTLVDLTTTIQDVAIELIPILSLNPLIQANVNAATGAQLTVDGNAGMLSGLTVTIPPGAFARDTTFTLGTLNNAGFLPPLPPEVIPVSPVLGFEAMGESLVEPASMAFPYRIVSAGTRQLELSEPELNGSAFHLCILTPGSTQWQSSGSATIDTNTETITVPFMALGSGVICRVMNTPPMATAPPLVTPEDQAGSSQISVQDPDGNQSHTFAITMPPAKGAAQVSASGFVTFTPNPNVNGPDTLTVTVTDAGEPPLSTPVQIPITITPVNDHPTSQPLNLITMEDVPFNGNLNAVDVDGDPLTFHIVQPANRGLVTLIDPASGAFSYTPQPHANGPDQFTFYASDGLSNSNIATVNLNISPVPDAPLATDNTLTVLEDLNATGVLSATDVDNQPLTFHIVSQGNLGTATIDNPNTGAFTYTPHPNVNGSDAFAFRANDGMMDSNIAVIHLAIAPVDDPPVAVDDHITTNEDTVANIPVLINDSEIDGEALTILGVTQGNQGMVTHDGTMVRYTPAPDINGVDSFTYTISDPPGGTSVATVNITITPVNDPPIALNRTLFSVDSIPTPGALIGMDVDGNPLTYSIVSPPSQGGSAALIDMFRGTYLYNFGLSMPPPDSLTYKVSDGTLESNIATVTVDPPATPYDLIYATQAGSMQDDEGRALAPFDNGSVVVTGSFEGTMILGKGSASETLLVSAGGSDIFIAKYLADGALAWAKRAGGPEDDEGTGVVVWPDDTVLITGHFRLNPIFGEDEPNATQLTSAGEDDIFVARYDPNGMLMWVGQAGGIGDDHSQDITPIPSLLGDVVITGSFQNTALFGAGQPGQVMLTSLSGSDIFIARYDLTGQLGWAKRAGGSGDDEGLAATTTLSHEPVITGSFQSTSTFGANEPGETMLTSNGQSDMFVAVYDYTNGQLIRAQQGGGSGEDAGMGVTTLFSNEIVVTGAFENTANFMDAELTNINLVSAGGRDIFVVQYDMDGLISWAVRAGGSGEDEAHSIIHLPDSSLAMSGAFEGTAIFGPREPGETMLNSNGQSDIFIAYYDFSGMLIEARGIGGPGDDEARDITVLPNGHPVVTGSFENQVTFGPGEPLETTLGSGGATDLFLSRFYWLLIPL